MKRCKCQAYIPEDADETFWSIHRIHMQPQNRQRRPLNVQINRSVRIRFDPNPGDGCTLYVGNGVSHLSRIEMTNLRSQIGYRIQHLKQRDKSGHWTDTPTDT